MQTKQLPLNRLHKRLLNNQISTTSASKIVGGPITRKGRPSGDSNNKGAIDVRQIWGDVRQMSA